MARDRNISPMSDEFLEWLNECPVTWHWLGYDEDETHVEYHFEIDD